MSVLLQRVVAAAVQGESHVEFDEVAREIFQAHWVHLSVQGRRDVISRLKSAAAPARTQQLRGFIRIEGSSFGSASGGDRRLACVGRSTRRSPEVAGIDAQGCTRPREGPSIVERQPQMSIDDLAIEVEATEELAPDSTGEVGASDTDDDA